MTDQDKKDFRLIVLEALDVLVIPKLEEVGKDVKVLKGDVKVLKEDVSDLQATTNRIETLVKSEIKYVDALDARVINLEKSKA